MKEEEATQNGEPQGEAKSPGADPFRDAMDELDPEESGYAPAYIFDNPGDMIVGKLTDIGEAFSKQYGAHPCVTVVDEADGLEKSIHVMHSTMLSNFERLNPGLGDRIALKRMADKKSTSSGFDYFRFLLKIDRKVGAVTRFNEIQSSLTPSADAADLTEPDKGEDEGMPF